MILAQTVQITNTLNITTILAVISAFSIIGGAFLTVVFKLFRIIQKEVQEIRLQAVRDHLALLSAQDAQTLRIEECIHKVPGHPEHSKENT